MLQKGDTVVFNIGENKNQYKVISSPYRFNGEGRLVVDLENYHGEVAVEYLRKVRSEKFV